MDPNLGLALVLLLTAIAVAAVANPGSGSRRPFRSQPENYFEDSEITSSFEPQLIDYQQPAPPSHRRRGDSTFAVAFMMFASLGVLAVIARYDIPSATAGDIPGPESTPRIEVAADTPATKPVQRPQPAENVLLLPSPTPVVEPQDAKGDAPLQAKGVILFEVYWVVWLCAYPTLQEAERLQRAFPGRPIQLAVLPNGRFLAFIHYADRNDNVLCAEDVNKHLADLRPFGIYTPRVVRDIGPVE